MKRILIWAGVILVVILIVFPLLTGLPLIRWTRRENPLRNPISVQSILLPKITLADGTACVLAGVKWPEDPKLLDKARKFLKTVVEQGVEKVREPEVGKSWFLRCEPRIFHWCGNDSVAAHYEQYVLNEIVIASGYADFDENAVGLTPEESLRLQACRRIAQESKQGLWDGGNGKLNYYDFDESAGLNISGSNHFRFIGEYAHQIEFESKHTQPKRR